jgi:hypothetical protein
MREIKFRAWDKITKEMLMPSFGKIGLPNHDYQIENGEYFVVYVNVHSDGLAVSVRRLGLGDVWDGEYRHRVVSPQLDF